MKCKIERGVIKQDGVFRDFEALNKDGEHIAKAETAFLNTNKKFAWMTTLQVDPNCREQGIGTEVIQQVAEEAKNAKAELIYVYPAVPPDEKMPISPSLLIKFYEKNGFVPCNAPKDVATLTEEGLKKRGMCLYLRKEEK